MVNTSAFSDMFRYFVVRQEPETACAPSGPCATRSMDFFKVITSPLALHISVDSTVAVMPSDETVVPPRLEVENALFR
jgi:hypothetical protein